MAARHRATEAALKRVHDAITRLRREKSQVSVAAVARRAGVSRTFLYSNPDARTAVAAALADAGERRVQMATAQDNLRFHDSASPTSKRNSHLSFRSLNCLMEPWSPASQFVLSTPVTGSRSARVKR
jgi:hypothetical protein